MLSSTQAQYAAEGAVELAVSRLLSSQPDRWPTDGDVRRIRIANARVSVRIFDEAGKIDLNYASADLLNDLLQSAGVEATQRSTLVDAILDWRDVDDLRRLNGAEDDEYSAAGLPYGAMDGNFSSVDELGLVLGMQHDILAAIRPVLTVFSRRAGVDPMVASARTLQVITGSSPEDAYAYVEQRRATPAGDVTASFNFIDDSLVTSSERSIYTIYVESRVDKSIVARVAATIKLTGGAEAYKLLDWKQVAIPLFADYSDEAIDNTSRIARWSPDE
jgi:general secretion pathway protein K